MTLKNVKIIYMETQEIKVNTFSHRVLHFLLRRLFCFYTRVFLGFRSKDKYKIARGEPIIIISNHQTDFDPLCIFPSFNKPIYPVATDNIFSGSGAKWLTMAGVIPKRKGASDIKAAMTMKKVVEKGGSLLLFPEGNRTYAEFQFFIGNNLASFIKRLKTTIVLYNICGGTGVSPRFKNKQRKGKFVGKIVRVVKPDEYEQMTNEELMTIIRDNIRVYDSESGNLYKSKKRAEYLERVFFVCPKCQSTQSLYSKNQYLYCNKCGLKVEYTEDLHLKSVDPDFKFTKMLDYWNYQKRFISNMEIKEDEVIFSDDNVKIITADPYKKRTPIYSGKIELTDKQLKYGSNAFNLKEISNSSVVSGRKLVFTYEDRQYMLIGHMRFNPVKYAFIFNKLETKMKEKNFDKYFNLKED